MKTIKKFTALTLAAFIALGAVGCQKKEESGIVELKYYAANTPQQEDEKVIAKVNEYLEDKIGVRIDWINIPPSEYTKKTSMIFATNEEFDVCFTASYTDFYNNVKNGVYLPLDELLKNEGKEIYEKTPEYFFDAAKVNGEIYALPIIKDVAEQWVIGCKTWLLEKYNLNVENITKLEELTPIFQTIKDNEPTYTPMLIRGNNSVFRFLPFEMINDVIGFNTNDFEKVINVYDTDEAKEFFKLMREWYQKGFVRSDAATATSDSDIRGANTWFAGYGGYLPYSEVQTNVKEDSRITNIMGMNEPHLRTGNILGAAFAISSNSKYPEKAMEFINLMNTDKYLRNLVGLGIEGEHWIAVGDNQYKLPDGAEKKEDTGYAPVEYTLGNRFLMRIEEGIPSDKWDKFNEFNNNAFRYPTIGFIFDNSNVSAEIASISDVYQKYAPSLLVGAVDPDVYLPKFLDELKTAGIEKVMAEAQKQYDDWKKNN